MDDDSLLAIMLVRLLPIILFVLVRLPLVEVQSVVSWKSLEDDHDDVGDDAVAMDVRGCVFESSPWMENHSDCCCCWQTIRGSPLV